MLLECRKVPLLLLLLLLLLSARDCLATRRENTLYPPRTYPIDLFQYLGAIHHLSGLCTTHCVACNNVELLLEQYAAVKQQQQRAYECCSSRVLLKSSVARVPLAAAAAATECSGARDRLATLCLCLSRARSACAIK